jgi:hypothetical protein
VTTDGDMTKSPSAIVCGATFTRDDGSQGTCGLFDGHPSGHTDIPAAPDGRI